MRSVLSERRHVNGHDLIEEAIAEAHRHMLDPIGQGISIRSANAYPSDAGVLAMIAQAVDQAVPPPAPHKQSTIFQPNAIR